jgi:hypothetical protein
MARRRKRQKVFPCCGRRGFGSYCHHCSQQAAVAQEQQADQAARRAEQHAWRATFEQDAIDLRVIQHRRDLVRKARDVLAAVTDGTHPFALGGKPLHSDRTIISVAISYDYRLIFQVNGKGFLPVALESHEVYNQR